MKVCFRPNRSLYQAIQNRLSISVEDRMDPKQPHIATVTNVDDPSSVYSRHGTKIIDGKVPELPAVSFNPHEGADTYRAVFVGLEDQYVSSQSSISTDSVSWVISHAVRNTADVWHTVLVTSGMMNRKWSMQPLL